MQPPFAGWACGWGGRSNPSLPTQQGTLKDIRISHAETSPKAPSGAAIKWQQAIFVQHEESRKSALTPHATANHPVPHSFPKPKTSFQEESGINPHPHPGLVLAPEDLGANTFVHNGPARSSCGGRGAKAQPHTDKPVARMAASCHGGRRASLPAWGGQPRACTGEAGDLVPLPEANGSPSPRPRGSVRGRRTARPANGRREGRGEGPGGEGGM